MTVARVEGKMRLIPVVIEECEIPIALQSTYRVRIKDLSSYEAELDQIVSAIYGLSDKPELGNVPAHTQSHYVAIPSLARGDNIVLRLACEDAIQQGDFASSPDILWRVAEPLGISREEIEDSLVILEQYGFIKAHRGDDRILGFEITLPGFQEYARAYIPDLNSIVHAVVARIVNDGMTDSETIRQSVEQPHVVVEYVLKLLAGIYKLDVRSISGKIHIGGVSPELKRMLR